MLLWCYVYHCAIKTNSRVNMNFLEFKGHSGDKLNDGLINRVCMFSADWWGFLHKTINIKAEQTTEVYWSKEMENMDQWHKTNCSISKKEVFWRIRGSDASFMFWNVSTTNKHNLTKPSVCHESQLEVKSSRFSFSLYFLAQLVILIYFLII